MDRDFRRGYIAIDFPAKPFTSVLRTLSRSVRLFLSQFWSVTLLTLVVFLPGKLLLQLACYALDISTSGILSYALLEVSDLVLGALAVPAVVYALVGGLRSGHAPAMRVCLRWGFRQFGRTLWNKFKVEVTVILWGAMLVIPGLLAMVRLIFTDVVVAVEGDTQPDPMDRSRHLSQGRRWRIFLVLAPLMLIDMLATFLILDRIPDATHSRFLFAIADSLLNVVGQLTTTAVLLMYLGLLPPGKKSQSYIRAA